MSKNYKDAMDKIIASDELKSRVLTAAAEKIAAGKESQAKRVRKIYIKRAISYAACLVICMTSVMLYKNFRTDKISVPPVPANTQVPVTPDPAAVPAMPKAENEAADAPKEHGGNPQKTAAPSEKRTGAPKKTPSPTAVPSDNPGKNEPPAVSAPAADDRNDTPDIDSDTPAATPSVGGSFDVSLPSDGLCGGNPFAEANSLGELYANAGYAFKMPYLLPDGYRLSSCTLIGGTLVQITCDNDTDTIIYRTEKSAQDISGDYNSYPDTVTIDVDGITAAARGFSGKYYSTVWQEGESSYSLGSTGGLSEEEIENIISGIDFYKKDE